MKTSKTLSYEFRSSAYTIRFSTKKRLSRSEIQEMSEKLHKLSFETLNNHLAYSNGLRRLKVISEQLIDNLIED